MNVTTIFIAIVARRLPPGQAGQGRGGSPSRRSSSSFPSSWRFLGLQNVAHTKMNAADVAVVVAGP